MANSSLRHAISATATRSYVFHGGFQTLFEIWCVCPTRMVLGYDFVFGESNNRRSITTQNTVYEYLGNTSFFLDPFGFLRNQLDFHDADALRCYQDSELDYQGQNLATACDFVVRTQEPLIAASTLFPNPARTYFNLGNTIDLETLQLYHLSGQLMRNFAVQDHAFN